MDLDSQHLTLIDPQDLSVLNVQPIQSIRVWGVGRDNGRYVYTSGRGWAGGLGGLGGLDGRGGGVGRDMGGMSHFDCSVQWRI